MTWLNTLASCGMAIGPPLVYLDQYVSILKKRNSDGFSREICGVLLISNITRIFYWLGERFEIGLLIQSILMILAQLGLLQICLRYATNPSPTTTTSRSRSRENNLGSPSLEQQSLIRNESIPEDLPSPIGISNLASTAEEMPEPISSSSSQESIRTKYCCNLWNWSSFGLHCEFLAVLVLVHVIFFLILHNYRWYVETTGYIALGLESTLPIPQLITNYQRKSLVGFRTSVLLGWLVGDGFKTIYFFLQPNNSLQFKVCAVFQLSIDFLILFQALIYRNQTKRDLELN
ncbi:uncharacterized protein MELLADRAFT_74774 [Melampsora larici-populina 98AG31]|uniref:PQ-loop repeat-containing protein 1 n=1 Tax=Melampsora larici-populina (strain 98AG31 / pathotype 3-4-7) TaxID=747676 RepID=F4RKS3_MELLP|nr:uncharacterized protein MELLADRAFT_74774 [Melampsora larici-populina 98AG31]EGG06990.1 hypothetical protein MELLADRAFT_74774 [Melampsora larici-populina 98AG31]